MNREQPQGSFQQFRVFLSWFVFLSQSLAVSLEVFLHRRFGERYVGLQGVAAILIIFFYAGFWPGYDVTPLLEFLLAYLALCFLARIGVLRRRRRGGTQEHSHYTGWPRVMRLTGRLTEITVKQTVEPLLTFLVAVFTLPVSEPLGGYLLLATGGLIVSVNASLGAEHTRAINMNDALIDQRHLAERFRGMRGDRF